MDGHCVRQCLKGCTVRTLTCVVIRHQHSFSWVLIQKRRGSTLKQLLHTKTHHQCLFVCTRCNTCSTCCCSPSLVGQGANAATDTAHCDTLPLVFRTDKKNKQFDHPLSGKNVHWALPGLLPTRLLDFSCAPPTALVALGLCFWLGFEFFQSFHSSTRQ